MSKKRSRATAAVCPENVSSKKGGSGGFAPQTLTRSYYFETPLAKKRSRATEVVTLSV